MWLELHVYSIISINSLNKRTFHSEKDISSVLLNRFRVLEPSLPYRVIFPKRATPSSIGLNSCKQPQRSVDLT